jgi:MYXO-CTERM domain-containing protein
MYSRTAAFLSIVVLSPSAASAAAPPDGWLLWQSTRSDSRSEVYRARADGSEVTRMTTNTGTIPMWAPDGRWISYKDESGTLFITRPDGSERRSLLPSVDGVPFWLHDNSGLAAQVGGEYFLVDPETSETTLMFSIGDFPAFADGSATFLWNGMTADNHYMVAGSSLYLNGYSGANGSITAGGFSAIVVDLLHKDRVYWFGLGCWPFTPPAGDLVFHICADCPTHPDIYHMSLNDLATRASYAPEVANPDPDWGHEYNPRVSNDNRWLVYMASAGCHDSAGCDYDIFLHEIGKGPTERTRIIQHPATDAYPALYVGPFWQPTAQPRLLVTPNRLTFFASANSLPGTQTIKLKNSGGGVLGAATLTIGSEAPWLNATLGTGTVTVGLNGLSGLARGTYQTTIIINVDGALDAPAVVPVTLVADESFPAPEVGVSEAGVTDGQGGQVAMEDAGAADASITTGGSKDDGCGCTLGDRRPRPRAWAFLLAALGLLVSRRRRR